MRVLLVTLFFVLPVVAAQDPGDFEDYDEDFESYQNGCGAEFSNDGNDLSYEAFCAEGNQQGGTFSGIEVIFEVGDGAEFLAEGGRYSGSGSGGSAVGFEYILDILQVVEFRDTDNDGKYRPDQDDIVHIDSLQDDWGAISATGLPNGGFEFSVDYDLDLGGTFTIRGKVTGTSYSEGGVRVTPLDTKIDFLFSGYGYEDETTQLAIVMNVVSEGGSASSGSGSFGQNGAVVQSGERGLVGTSGSNHIYFTWAKTALVDGSKMPVGDHVEILHSDSGSFEGDGGSYSGYEAEAGITLAYPQGDEIVHDPRLGVQFNVKKDSPGPAVILPLVALLALAAWRRSW